MWSKIFSAEVRRREAIIFAICFVFSFLLNLFVVVKYADPWYEVFTSVLEVLVQAALIYGLLMLLRIAWHIMCYVWRK